MTHTHTGLQDAYIISARRAPVGRYGGALASVRPDDLAAAAIAAAVHDAGIDPGEVNEVIFGNANGAGEENRNVARMAWLLAGFPHTVPGLTINRLCASGMTSLSLGQAMIQSGQADVVVCGGVESMSRAPWVMEKPATAFAKPGQVFDTSIGWRFINPVFAEQEKMTYSMPETAEEVARVCGISRKEADHFAVQSHRRALAAQAAGKFDSELVSITTYDRKGTARVVAADEGPRENTSVEVLSRLRPVVAGGEVVTAGNSSSLNDGASAVVLASEAAMKKLRLRPRARIVAGAAAGVAPEVMGLGPIPATTKALAAAGWKVGDVQAVELNEAFATQSLACMDQLGLDPETVNAWGGAIALGHPLGSSGSRIVTTLLHRMEDADLATGLATMCVGVGQGTALLIERMG